MALVVFGAFCVVVFSANYAWKLLSLPQMPPKARTSGRLVEKQNKKRKVDEIEEDLSKEERPKKKAKILPEKKGKKSQKVEEIAEATITNDEKNDASEINLADQPPVEGGRPSRRAKKVVVLKIVKTVPEDPNKSAEELAQKQRALQRLTTLKEQRQIAPRIADEEYTLPDELILQIFSCLKRRDFYSIGATCRQWHRLSNDHSLGWHLALSMPLIEAIGVYTYYEDPENVRRKLPTHEDQIALERACFESYMKKHPGVPATIHYSGRGQGWWNNPEDNPEESVDEEPRGNYIKLRDANRDVVAFANLYPPKFPLYYGAHLYYPPCNELNSRPDLWYYRIRSSTLHQMQESGIIDKEDIDDEFNTETRCWFVDIEINIKCLEKLVLDKKEVPGMEFIYYLVELDFCDKLGKISSAKQSSIPKKSFTAQQQPEGFKNEIKLYKYQLDAISWMKSVEDNTEGLPYFNGLPWRIAKTDIIFDVHHKRIAKNLIKYVDIATSKGGVLADEMGLGKTLEVVGLVLSNPASVEETEHARLIKSRATLVLCPSHLAHQWEAEAAKTTQLKVVVITTIAQHRKCTYEDFMNSDLVIVSCQFLQNQNYFHIGAAASSKSVKKGSEVDRMQWVDKYLDTIKAKNNWKQWPSPIIEHFDWHRIVLDEGHEFLAVPFYEYTISAISSRYSWYVTGTPFPKVQLFKNVREFLGLKLEADIALRRVSNFGTQQQAALSDLMVRELYWRHTKETVKGEYEIPECVEDLVLMEFDEIESALYADARDEDSKSQFCGSLIQNKNLDGRRALGMSNKKTSIVTLTKTTIPSLTAGIASAREVYESETDNLRKYAAQSLLNKREKQLADAKDQLEHDKNVLSMLEKTVPLNERKNKVKQAELIAKLGTKLTQIILYLKKLFAQKPNSRVIFFSQFNGTLNTVSDILYENGIDNVFVEGNVHNRTRAIKSFREEDDVKVIMLSLRNAASGTNLVEATHIVLMDPVTGSKKEAQAIESQAIGRAHRQGQTKQITIVRFVVKNTIEHALYLRNNDVNEDTTVVISDNKPQLVRSSSLTSLVASNNNLKRSASLRNIADEKDNK